MRLVGLAVVAALALAGEVRAEKVNWDEYIDKSPPRRVTVDKPAATTPAPRAQVQRKRVAQPAVKKKPKAATTKARPRARRR